MSAQLEEDPAAAGVPKHYKQADRDLGTEHLNRVLQSETLRSSANLRRLLEYVGKQSLNGEVGNLKEYTIGVEVLDRPTDFDPKTDTIVRVQIHRLREKLLRYYASEGKTDTVRINIPAGGYRATFETDPEGSIERASDSPIPTVISSNSPTTEDKPPRASLIQLSWMIAGIITALVAIVLFAMWIQTSATRDRFHDFWQPMLTDRSPTMVYLGTNTSFRLTPGFIQEYREKYKLPESEFDQPIDISREQISASDLTPNGPLVGLGDTAAASRIASTLTGFRKAYDMRYGQDLGVSDLHAGSAILIGGFSNRRSIEMMRDLRFRLEKGDRIVDHGQKDRSWVIHYSPDGRVIDDYVIVSRIPKSETGGFILAITGIATFSNQAAADFLSNESRMNALLKSAPIGWQHMNMQVVLHTRAIEMIPVSTDIETVSYW